MVTSVLNYGRSGVHDWVMQRFSALVLAAYTVVMVGWLLVNGEALTFAQWREFMGQTWVRIFSLLAVLSLAGHAWIGLWTVATDYLKVNWVRVAFLATIAVSLFVYVVWAISILWGF
ncbi:MAG: succinate dehydrogenase, hydrophobic membrane anchor protein [Litorivicinaceae bacterium]|jgi:succinate dehydrogenase / fumarate reductase, membrane anchor subunit|nr:succinate dehydrogenase, hydrophobic membrane anchor protein [Litorivicinaceae bacterium]MDP5344343.1 succinate dehydrogenase, hydrophobic membrane anchor protein [Litorivicinaceae bacterium]